ncbi:MAG: hypothetical protein KGH84_03530 [Paracoccaceae bacterium]|nr:hypothetical protein [Paracoccaceae bacterium]
MLGKRLTEVFDPPPEVLSVPLGYLAALVVPVTASAITAVLVAQRSLGAKGVELVRDL